MKIHDENQLTDITHLFEHVSGVYILYENNIIVYIGQSTNIVQRVNKHRSDNRFCFDKVLVHWCTSDELDTLEFKYINQHRPKFNRTNLGSTFGSELDLVSVGIDITKLTNRP